MSFGLGNGTVYSGAGPAGTPAATVWTSAPGPGEGPYVDGATGVGLRVFNGTAFINNSGAGFRNLTNDFVYDGTGGGAGIQTANFQLSGLDDSLIYDVYFIAPNGQQFGGGNVYGGVYRSGTTNAASSGSLNADTAWTEGQNYAVLRGLRSTAGVINGTYEENQTNLNPNNFGIAGVQIMAFVPEPTTTFALVGILGGAFLRRRRRSIS